MSARSATSCPVAPGGGGDFVGRTVCERWAKALGQTIVVDNLGGGGGGVAIFYDVVLDARKEDTDAAQTFDRIATRRHRARPGTAQDTLTVWWVKGFYKMEDNALHSAIEKFKALRKINVELSQYPEQDMIPKTVAALDSGSPPDVAYADV